MCQACRGAEAPTWARGDFAKCEGRVGRLAMAPDSSNESTLKPGKSSSLDTHFNAPGNWDIFIGHSRRNAKAELLAEALWAECSKLGLMVWLDVKMGDKSEAAMEEGVKNSRAFIAVVTGPCVNIDAPDDPAEMNAYFKRPYCIKELRWAREAGVPIQPVIRAEDKMNIGDLLGLAPEDLQDLEKTDWID